MATRTFTQDFGIIMIITLAISLMVQPLVSGAQTMSAPDGVRQSSQANWTVMVYMSGDSTLSSNVASDISEMKEVGSDDSLNIIVLADRSGVSDTSLHRVLDGSLEDIPLSQANASWANELDLGSPQTLVDFVTWAVGAYPAEHFILDLWGHGNGWIGLCPDKDNALTTKELGAVMEAISDNGINLDIVTIDACQMGMIETVYELRHASTYAIVSEKDIPLAGWPYDDVLSILANDPSISVEDFGMRMINAYMDWGLMHSRYSLTASMIDLGRIEDVVDALDSYSVEVGRMVGFFNPEILLARSTTEEYDGSHEYDLWHLLNNINYRTRCKRLDGLSAHVISRLNYSMVYERHWTNVRDEPADNAHGLSIYFPPYSPSAQYQSIDLSLDSGWDEFLIGMAPFISSPSRIEVSLSASAISVDTDSDGLKDTLDIDCHVPSSIAGGLFELEVYAPNRTLVRYFSSTTTGWQNFTYVPEALGSYSAAIYLWDAQGHLSNYTLVDTGLDKEGFSKISGKVTSDIGRGLRWVQISLFDADGDLITSTVTDMNGRYELELKVPTDTDGLDLTLSCGLGSQGLNNTIGSLFSVNIINFEMVSAHGFVLWLTYAALTMNFLAAALLVGWLLVKRVPEKE